MSHDILNIGLGFLEGFALIISPCILPILPIILVGSLEGDRKRPLGIIIGFVLAFSLFTFFSRELVQYSGINISLIRYISYILLVLLGVVMMSTYLTEKFARLTQRLANTGSGSSLSYSQSGFFSGVIFGMLIGLIWTPCAGPILAAVIVQTVIQKTNVDSFFIVLAFGIGAALPMLMIALFGRALMAKLSFFKQQAVLCRKLLGVIIIASVVYMLYGEGIIPAFAKPTTTASIPSPILTHQQETLVDGVTIPYAAPAIGGITEWINSPPLQLSELKGQVVLIDFWTYSCINCARTLPYLKDWYQKYHDKGLVIIGVHAPEFEFEKNVNNVKTAVEKYGIQYPVALDNQFVTWQNYNNHFWPAHYLIDKEGHVVYQHFGEGEYATTESNIRFLLGLPEITMTSESEKFVSAMTPETYLGSARMENYASPETIPYLRTMQYSFPESLLENQWALQGSWLVEPQRIISKEANAVLKIHFNAKKVYVVMGSSTGFPIHVKLLLNGEAVLNEKGKDVTNSAVDVGAHALFEVLVLPHAESGILQLIASAPGLEVYTFTFGG